MSTIWKYVLQPADEQYLEVPEGAAPLTVKTQGDDACIWFLVDPNAPKVQRRIEIYGTGQHIDERITNGLMYVGTFQLAEGRLVFHVFA